MAQDNSRGGRLRLS